MREGCNDIYYITGESIAAVSSSPLPGDAAQEVFHTADPIDEYGVQQPKDFDGKKLESTTKEAFPIDDEKKKTEEPKAEFEHS